MSEQDSVLARMGRGAIGGAAATVPMTAVMLLAQRMGWLGRPPPDEITEAVLEGAGLEPHPRKRVVLSALAHIGFGAAAGALFALLRPGRRSRLRTAVEGAGYGTAVWTASYAKVIPELGIMPSPADDRRGRPASMVVAHWVYGAALGALVARPG